MALSCLSVVVGAVGYHHAQNVNGMRIERIIFHDVAPDWVHSQMLKLSPNLIIGLLSLMRKWNDVLHFQI